MEDVLNYVSENSYNEKLAFKLMLKIIVVLPDYDSFRITDYIDSAILNKEEVDKAYTLSNTIEEIMWKNDYLQISKIGNLFYELTDVGRFEKSRIINGDKKSEDITSNIKIDNSINISGSNNQIVSSSLSENIKYENPAKKATSTAKKIAIGIIIGVVSGILVWLITEIV